MSNPAAAGARVAVLSTALVVRRRRCLPVPETS